MRLPVLALTLGSQHATPRHINFPLQISNSLLSERTRKKLSRLTMASYKPNNRTPMYPQVIESNPAERSPSFQSNPPQSSSKPSLYPTIDMNDLVVNLFPNKDDAYPYSKPNVSSPSAPPDSVEEILLTVRGSILHLIDKQYSVELASGDLHIVQLREDANIVAVMARVADETQWPLTKDVAVVKLDDSHYFFSFKAPKDTESDSDDEADKLKGKTNDFEDILNYGLTIASKGQENLLKHLDGILGSYSSFSMQRVEEKGRAAEVLNGKAAKDVSPEDLQSEKEKETMERKCAAYWTTLAPNVEDYSGSAAKLIAAGSGKLIKGILWCGDVTVDRLNWGNEVLKKRMSPRSKSEISPQTLKRIRRVKRVTKMTEHVASGVLSGVVKVSGLFTSSLANSKVGKKFFNLLPGEIVLASLDGFSKIGDAVEVAGKNVMSTSSTVTTGLVNHRYGEDAAQATSEGLDVAGHAIGTAWTAFKIRKALNPKNVLKPSTLAKSTAKAVGLEKKAKSFK